MLRQLNARLPYGLCYAAQEQIEGWFGDLRAARRSKNTIANYDYHTRGFYSWATKRGYLDGDPTADIPKPGFPRGIPDPTTEEHLALVLTLDEPWRTAALLAAFAGLRSSECAGCHREHITVERLIVPHGKGDEAGVVPTHPYLWEHIKDRPRGPLIVNHRTGQPVTGHWLTVHMRKRIDERLDLGWATLGSSRVHLHALRHRYGTVIQEAGGDLRLTQECMRHKSSASTEVYTKVTNKRRSAAVAALPVPEVPAS